MKEELVDFGLSIKSINICDKSAFDCGYKCILVYRFLSSLSRFVLSLRYSALFPTHSISFHTNTTYHHLQILQSLYLIPQNRINTPAPASAPAPHTHTVQAAPSSHHSSPLLFPQLTQPAILVLSLSFSPFLLLLSSFSRHLNYYQSSNRQTVKSSVRQFVSSSVRQFVNSSDRQTVSSFSLSSSRFLVSSLYHR